MEVKNFYIVETPLQLLNANEAINYFPASKHFLYIRFSGSIRNDEQLKSTALKISFPLNVTIQHIYVNGSKKSILDLLKVLYYQFKFARITSSVKNIFVGDYKSRFIKRTTPFSNKTILLDDGLSSIHIQDHFSNEKNYDWFSMFDIKPLDNQTIYPNLFSNLHSKLHLEKTSENHILFIGSKLSEAEIISLTFNIALIKETIQLYPNSIITYIPHREETEEKLMLIEELKNVTVKKLTYPIEMLPIYSQINPYKIISFFSTALITLQKIYQVETIAHKFDYSKSQHRKNIDHSYGYCAKYMRVIQLNSKEN